MRALYFDYNATSPVHPRVVEAITYCLNTDFGNPGSGHMWGIRAKRAVERAREQVARLIGASPEQIVFTGCATESNNLVVKGSLGPLLARGGTPFLAVSAVEHPAILEPAGEMEARGAILAVLEVDGQGMLAPETLSEAIAGLGGRTGDGGLVSAMLANNETGVLSPVAELAAMAHSHGLAMHTDAAQAVAKIPVDVDALGVDFLTIAGHKMYAPKGVGALYLRDPDSLAPQLTGGGQERGVRPGTENVAYIAGLGEACAMASEDLAVEEARQRGLGRTLLKEIGSLDVPFVVHGGESPRLPNVLNIGFRGYMAGDILSGLVARDVGVSGGAACHSGQVGLSHVLEAMKVDRDFGSGAIRFSWGRMTGHEDVLELVRRLGEVLREL